MAKESEKIQDLEGEVWKDIQGYEGLYQISNIGRVKSCIKTLKTNNRFNSFVREKQERLISQTKERSSKHYHVSLTKKKFTRKLPICNLVATHFVANHECLDLVKHIDGNIENNRACNLQWHSSKVEDLPNEIWKEVEGFEAFYHISNLGRIKKLKRDVYSKNGRFLRRDPEKLNKNHINKKRGNYYLTDLAVKGKRKSFWLHRLIAIHFIPNPQKKKYVNHIDGNPQNNAIENLEWVTNMENICHAHKRKKSTSNYIGVGWDKYAGKWKSQIYHKGKSVHIGSFVSEEEAYEARRKFEQDNGIENKYL